MQSEKTLPTEEQRKECLHLVKDATGHALEVLTAEDVRMILDNGTRFGLAIRHFIRAFPATLKKREPELGNPDVSFE